MSTDPPNEGDVFGVARQIQSEEARLQYLNQVCGDDTARRARILRLLDEDKRDSFLEKPILAAEATLDASNLAEKEGQVVGPYKLLQQIGEGGFGIVYMAEQQRPVRRKVALKLIKPGMDTKEVIGRFESERQALAMMDHPNIAKVFDAGTTQSGRPYFVMELVKGIPITDYCDRQRLGTRQRLELFVKVCHAVQHAHQKGIIHRDIKPSNVLVTEHDGAPVPKVIDFGVAKAINQQLTERTLFTRFQQMVGTPMYMSPEQADLSGLDVDTRTDIYSLGVLLYELLTGVTPFDSQRFSEVAYDEIRRVIREEEPPKPSTRVSSLGDSAKSISGHRSTDRKKLTQLMRGELDWVIMKAMDKDRTRRYETSTSFGLDVQRFLDNEPVSAAAPSAFYRFRKFTRRNRTSLATASALIVALVLGTSVSVWQAVQATRNATSANEAKSESEANLLLADQNLSAAQRNLYASDMLLAQQALSGSNRGRAQQLLDRHRPSGETKDLRGWEWDFLWQQCQSDALYQIGTRPDSIKSVRFGLGPSSGLNIGRCGTDHSLGPGAERSSGDFCGRWTMHGRAAFTGWAACRSRHIRRSRSFGQSTRLGTGLENSTRRDTLPMVATGGCFLP